MGTLSGNPHEEFTKDAGLGPWKACPPGRPLLMSSAPNDYP